MIGTTSSIWTMCKMEAIWKWESWRLKRPWLIHLPCHIHQELYAFPNLLKCKIQSSSFLFYCLDSPRLREFLTIFAQSSIPDLALLVEVNTWKLIPGWSKILSEFYLAEWCVSKLRNLSVLRSSLDFLDFEFAARIDDRAVSKNSKLRKFE